MHILVLLSRVKGISHYKVIHSFTRNHNSFFGLADGCAGGKNSFFDNEKFGFLKKKKLNKYSKTMAHSFWIDLIFQSNSFPQIPQNLKFK